MNAWEVCFGEHLSVWNLILPFDVEEFPDAHSVVQLVGMAAVYTVQVSLSYNRVGITTTLWTFSLA